MNCLLSFYKFKLPLKLPYKLSFGPISYFHTFIVVARSGDRTGFGEITPLPGYSHETVDSVEHEIRTLQASEKKDTFFTAGKKSLEARAPFFLSGLQCALETCSRGVVPFFSAPIDRLNIVAFCGGNTAEESVVLADKLVTEGYSTLKIKVRGANVPNEVERIRAVAESIGDSTLLRIDANQSYSWDDACFFCKELSDLKNIQLLEQPFRPDAWKLHERLANEVSIPIMLDESIWSANDIKKAADCGARYIKLKLCKHPGIEKSLKLIEFAKQYKLDIVYGNGVQTELGNQLEALVYQWSKLKTAFEGNGFLKLSQPFLKHTFTVDNGMLSGSGIAEIEKEFLHKHDNLIAEFELSVPDNISLFLP